MSVVGPRKAKVGSKSGGLMGTLEEDRVRIRGDDDKELLITMPKREGF